MPNREEVYAMSQSSPKNARTHSDTRREYASPSDLWGIRAPVGTPHAAERRPSHSADETKRLLALLLNEPQVRGFLHNVLPSQISSAGSGATMLYGHWNGLPDATSSSRGAADLSSQTLP